MRRRQCLTGPYVLGTPLLDDRRGREYKFHLQLA